MVVGILVLVGLIAVLLCYILLAPITFYLNSTTGICLLRFHRLAQASLHLDSSTVRVQLQILGFRKQVEMGKPPAKEVTKREPKHAAKKRKPTTRPFHFVLRKLLAAIRTTRVKRCLVAWDTGDMATNGILYPWVAAASHRWGHPLYINFWGEQTLILKLEWRIARVLWAVISN